MADDERGKKFHPPRRNPQQNRPSPGVQKAIQTLGVRDLREILDKKRQEHGDSQGPGIQSDKKLDLKQVKLPPPDPSYNYLKDPTRDKSSRPFQNKSDHDKHFERPIARDRETNPHYERPITKDRETNPHPHPRYKEERHMNRNWENIPQQERTHHSRDTRHQENKKYQDKERYQAHKYQENKENTNRQEKGDLKMNLDQSEGGLKKELRFSENPTVEGQSQFPRGGRRGSRSRNMRRGGGMARNLTEEKIENPFNIKIELSTATGRRNCTLDENTKIPDLKHVPDQLPYEKYTRGNRSTFRGRRRGKGNFRDRGGSSYRGRRTEPSLHDMSNENSFNMEELRESLPDAVRTQNIESTENGNVQIEDGNFKGNNEEGKNRNEEAREGSEEIFERYDDYDQDDEYNDANENYDEDEFPDEYYSEYQNESADNVQNLDNSRNYESSPESEKDEQGTPDVIDPDLKGTITITSSKFQDGVVMRSIDVIPKIDVEEKGGHSKEGAQEKKEEM